MVALIAWIEHGLVPRAKTQHYRKAKPRLSLTECDLWNCMLPDASAEIGYQYLKIDIR